jgi:ribosomal protein L21E
VTFDGKAGTVTSDSSTTITVKVPTGAKTGKIKVTTAGGSATSSASFTVT